MTWAQEKETWVKFNPGLNANRPSNMYIKALLYGFVASKRFMM